jgi:hypothetical protein
MPEQEIVRVREHGTLWKLRPPHTVESIRADAKRSFAEKRPWRCRHRRHDNEVVGDVYIPPADPANFGTLVEATLAVISSTDAVNLLRCKRCGAIRERGR